ncbi:hypothetical protein [Candidatus Viridilinea mediisalina]|uniref:Uncharacterized protein n=1 Tax=Candidatus Viridilinea mediisalina TaxID=2024553 RepID=A0A2A6RGM7_9CHLR|nr:hypothetical protein [Candidatus Viridilinea mediisalina]PDW02091.1 hypothetical protein CJ255_15700 [Candidatus Viridilinea mediisalina]
MTNESMPTQSNPAIADESLSRALVFSSFWGSIFYLLSFVSQLLTFRLQPAEVYAKTVVTGGAIFVSSFVGLGSLGVAASSLRRGKTPAAQAREQFANIGDNQGARVLGAAMRAGAGSLIPLALTAASLRLAEEMTGEPALAPQSGLSLPRSAVANALLTGLIAAAVTQITGWVARDAQVQ